MKHTQRSWVIGCLLCMCQVAIAAQTTTQTITFSGTPLRLNQGTVQLGQVVPAVDLVNGELNNTRVGGESAKRQVIATVVSLDTPVCRAEVKRLDQLARHLRNVQFTIVANVSPFQLASFTRKNNLHHVKLVSNFRTPAFDNLYGTRIISSKLSGLNTRAVFILDEGGHLVYQQFATELNRPPNYKSLRLALRDLQQHYS